MQIRRLWTDVETFSSENIKDSGTYRYFEPVDFEVLMISHGMDDDEMTLTDLCSGEKLPQWFVDALNDPNVYIMSRNAVFERLAFKSLGFDIPASRFHCTAVYSGYSGIPLSLADSGHAIGLEDGKDVAGTALINYFSVPCNPTKSNGYRTRNLPHHNPDKWDHFCRYCIKDSDTDRRIFNKLINSVTGVDISPVERKMYILDQKINDRGVRLDMDFVQNVIKFDTEFKAEVVEKMQKLTGVENPNSVEQLKNWLNEEMDENIKSLNKKNIPDLIKEAGAGSLASELLELRIMASKTSVKKYYRMVKSIGFDGRARGLFQFNGAFRTGRWAGRLIQLQNLPKNDLDDLDFVRKLVADGDYHVLELVYPDIAFVLSQLVRTAIIADEGKTFGVADFSAIEARVIAWLSGEQWRLDVFNSHGMIYEASASQMFKVPLDSIVKKVDGKKVNGPNYHLRARGKVSELALGYQGSVGALKQMGGEEMGLKEHEMKDIVAKWRKANPKIQKLWYDFNDCAIECIEAKRKVVSKFKGIEFNIEGDWMTIKLPSGRKLCYYKPFLGTNRFGGTSIKYWGVNDKKQWTTLETYGGKLVENVVQAIARDLLVVTMLRLDKKGIFLVMHVHDEVVAELDKSDAEEKLKLMCNVMAEPVRWAEGLPLKGDGYLTDYYKKD